MAVMQGRSLGLAKHCGLFRENTQPQQPTDTQTGTNSQKQAKKESFSHISSIHLNMAISEHCFGNIVSDRLSDFLY